MSQQYQIVLCTCPNAEVAQNLALSLVTKSLAACVNIIPTVQSVYRWQGKIETEKETLLLIKTASNCYNKLESAICELHPYELPEIVAVDIERGLPGYLSWLGNNLH